MKRDFIFRRRFKIVSIMILILIISGLSMCGDDSSSTPSPVIDSDGDTLSTRTTGISLPQSFQTVPAESTESRARKVTITQEDLR